MQFLFEDLRLPKSKPVLDAIKRLMLAGVSLEKIAEGFSTSLESDKKILAIAEASDLIRVKAVSFNRLDIIYESSPERFDIFCKELQEIYDNSSEKYFELTKHNWDFFTHFISNHKTPKDFEALYIKEPKKFNKLRSKFN